MAERTELKAQSAPRSLLGLEQDLTEHSQLVTEVGRVLGGSQQVDELSDGRDVGVDLVYLDRDAASERFELQVSLCCEAGSRLVSQAEGG